MKNRKWEKMKDNTNAKTKIKKRGKERDEECKVIR